MTEPRQPPRRRADDLFDRWDKRVRDLLIWCAGMVLILNETLFQRLTNPPDRFSPSYIVVAVGGAMIGLPFLLIGDELRRAKQQPEEQPDEPTP